MRIIIFTPQIHTLGGAERLAVELAEELNRRAGIQADLLSMRSEDYPGTEAAKERLLANGIRSIRFFGRNPCAGWRGFVGDVQRLRRILIEGKYDVIETSQMVPSTLAAWAVRGLGISHAAGLHRIYQRNVHRGARVFFFRWSCRSSRPTSFYGISQEVSRQWIQFSGVQQSRVRTIYNSVNSAYFQAKPERELLAQELNLNSGSQLLLFVGRPLQSKGLDTLIEAVKPMLKNNTTTLLVVGTGALDGFSRKPVQGNQFEDGVKHTLSADALSHAVRWLGWRDDIPTLMASADVLVHPTLDEGFGLVVAEALAVGLPVVASSVGGIPEVVEGTDSILVPPGDPLALRGAIHSVIRRTPLEIEASRIKGSVRAERFRTERRTDNLLDYFRELTAL